MKTFFKVLAGVLVVVLAVIGINSILLSRGIETPLSEFLDDTKNAAANAALDATGIKAQAQDALKRNTSKIAEKTGLPISTVNSIVSDIDIESWQVTSLPSNVTVAGSTSINYNGTNAVLTTYDDPSVVTVNTAGTSITLEVPPNAQPYIGYLEYM